jgi:hypothetical protein
LAVWFSKAVPYRSIEEQNLITALLTIPLVICWAVLNYIAKWQLKSNQKYKWTTCKKLVNTNTCREIKKTRNGNCKDVGYYIDGRFIKCCDLKNEIELIPIISLPF